MTYDVENLLISKILLEKDPVPALEAKINNDFFAEARHREVWEFITEHWGEYGEVPSGRTVKSTFPNYRLLQVDEPYLQLIDDIRARRKYDLAAEMAMELNSRLGDDDVEGAMDSVASGLTRILTQVSVMRDMDLSRTTDERMERYMAFSDDPDALIGLPTGFPSIDEATNGLQREQFVTLVGLPKRGKSAILMRIAEHVHLQGKKVLFVSFEMSNEEQAMRYDAMRAQISLTNLQRGRLTKSQHRRLEEAMDEQKKDDFSFILTSDIASATTVSGISAKIEQYKPDVVFIDGVYLMDDEQGETKGSSQALTNITRSLKRMAQIRRIPVVGTTQVLTWKYRKSQGITDDSIGYTSSFIQDSDVVLGVDNTEDEDIKILSIVLSRNCSPREVAIRADWDTCEFEELGDYVPSGWEEEEAGI